MTKTRILLTGADTLTGSHILAQLLSSDAISVRAVVNSQEALHATRKQYQQVSSTVLDLFGLSTDDHTISGSVEDALCDSPRPFEAVIHTLIPKTSDEADCLTKFIHLETESIIRFLTSIQHTAPYVRRVVIVTSLAPFARWLVNPQSPRSPGQVMSEGFSTFAIDAEHILATSQASSSTMCDAILEWRRECGAQFDIAYVATPSVYGPTIHPLETSSDLSETNRRIWNICSSEPQQRTENPPYGISHYSDVRDVATASVRALFVAEASNKRFVVSAGVMPLGSEIAEYLVARYPELRSRIRADGHPQRRSQFDDSALDALDAYLVTTVLGLSQLRTAEATINDTVRQILDLQQRKAWKSIIHS
ncbi:NAD(P)-binding protein [Ophiobolus disseminans]|uniref:NAD(P)-binding protein n=1 Tax=Ophiobolus disseminans TaxID=1469910 RepID=A0A6A6ZR33_9PLEO|nr:NAD(P)-binding protein [Ophiobolus disseminans]